MRAFHFVNRLSNGCSRVRVVILVACCLLALAPAPARAQKGHLILIGGGARTEPIMRKFVDLAGGPDALILVVPTASELHDTGARYVSEFRSYGCKNVRSLIIRNPEEARHGDWEALVPMARGIFFSGGDQARIMQACEKSPFEAALRLAYQRGAVIGGTSAGTACMSALMMTGKGNPGVIRAGGTVLVPGLGLFRGVILDQHFIVRQRQNRLLTVIAEHPDLLGVGVDESTAVWVRPDRTFQVLGESSVMVVDASQSRVTKGFRGNLGVRDLKVHILLPGEIWRLEPATSALPAPGQ